MRNRKYNPDRSQYSKFCNRDNCSLDVVQCNHIMEDGKPCGQHGHPVFYKHDENNIIPIVNHCHFLANPDVSRNVFHRNGKPRICPEELKVYTWKLKQNWERYGHMPKEVLKALGWY